MGSKKLRPPLVIIRSDPEQEKKLEYLMINHKEREEQYRNEKEALMKNYQDQRQTMNVIINKLKDLISTRAGALAKDPYNENTANIDDTKRVRDLLEKKREEIRPKAAELEDSLRQTAQSGFDIIVHEMERIEYEAQIMLNTDAVKNNFNNQLRQLDGSVSTQINRRVAISDDECSDLLEITDCDERESRLDVFIGDVIKEGVENSQNQVEKVMEDALNNVELIVMNRINDKKEQLRLAAEELSIMKDAFTNDEAAARKKQYDEEFDKLGGFLQTLGAFAGKMIGTAVGGPSGGALGEFIGTSVVDAGTQIVNALSE